MGSTPGKSTKKMGMRLEDSSNTSYILKAGYSMNSSPIASLTKLAKAEVVLSGLKALNNNNFWNLVKSFMDLGKSTDSAFSSLYHFFHCNISLSKD